MATGGIRTGLGSRAMRAGIRRGFRPAEAAGQLGSFFGGVGVAGSGRFVDPNDIFRAISSGINAQMMARVLGTGGAGGGATEGVGGVMRALRGVITVGQQEGLRGRRLDEILARMSSAVTMFAEQGMRLSTGAVATAFNTLRQQGAPFAGTFGMQGALKLSQTGMQGVQGIRGMFGGLAQGALLAEAFQGTDDPLAAMQRAERLASDPLAVQRAIRGQLGDEAAGFAFAGAGFSAEQSRILSRELDPVAAPQGRIGREGRFGVSSALARQDAATMSAALNSGVSSLISSMTRLQLVLIRAGGHAARLVNKVDQLLSKIGDIL